ncbi:LamG-like jellyroll fold domain-containing protein [Neptunomonas antarctica]|uniref:LamG-like jellyroll fold domain-containing protein n=1 Tax=Neptunomonas antarctica TaxID=619304 RepID=UPI0006C822E2|nr:LamG-like jellyroll fold domain-containing protein [Neptunomonas antarctica]
MPRYGATLTLPAITGSHTNFAVLLTNASFPVAAIDGGATSIANGGGNLRAYTDDTKATQLPVEVISFVTGGSPQIQVRVKTTAYTGATIYIESDTVASLQPGETEDYGRNNVWTDYLAVLHLNDSSYVDSTGNGHDGVAYGAVTQTTYGAPFGSTWTDFGSTTSKLTLTDTANLLDSSFFTITTWNRRDVLHSGGIISNRHESISANWFQLNARGSSNEELQGIVQDGAGESGAITGPQYVNISPVTKTTRSCLSSDAINCYIYVNGVIAATNAMPGNGQLTNSQPILVGNYYNGNLAFNGKIGSVTIRLGSIDPNREAAEHSNESSDTTWLTVGAWDDQDVGGAPTYTITLDSIASGATVGQSALAPSPVSVQSLSVASGGSVGEPSFIPIQSISAEGVGTDTQVGGAVITPGPVVVESVGVSNPSAVGALVFNQGGAPSQVISAEGVGTDTQVGGAVITPAPVVVESVGVSNPSAVGALVFNQGGAPSQVISTEGVGTDTQVGGAVITPAPVVVESVGVSNPSAVGALVFNQGGAPSQVISTEGVGTDTQVGGAVITPAPVVVESVGVSNPSAVGALVFNQGGAPSQVISTEGVGTDTQVGGAVITPAPVVVESVGVSNPSAVGALVFNQGGAPSQVISTEGVGTDTQVGGAVITPAPVVVESVGVSTSAAVGESSLSAGTVSFTPSSIASGATVGQSELAPSPVSVQSLSVASGGSVGEPSFIPIQSISAEGVGTDTQVGGAVITPAPVVVESVGVSTSAAVGESSLSAGTVSFTPSSIAETATIGVPALISQEQTLHLIGLDNSSAAGVPRIGEVVSACPIACLDLVVSQGTLELLVWRPTLDIEIQRICQ